MRRRGAWNQRRKKNLKRKLLLGLALPSSSLTKWGCKSFLYVLSLLLSEYPYYSGIEGIVLLQEGTSMLMAKKKLLYSAKVRWEDYLDGGRTGIRRLDQLGD